MTRQSKNIIAENRRARFDYHIDSDLEAGIVLTGPEVKSLRQGGANISDSYAAVEEGELWLVNGYIAPYGQSGTFGAFEERRRRKLLVSKREIARFWAATQRQGMVLKRRAEAVLQDLLAPIRARRKMLASEAGEIRKILEAGTAAARETVQPQHSRVRRAFGLA